MVAVIGLRKLRESPVTVTQATLACTYAPRPGSRRIPLEGPGGPEVREVSGGPDVPEVSGGLDAPEVSGGPGGVPDVPEADDVGSMTKRAPSNASRTSSRCGAILLHPVQVRMGSWGIRTTPPKAS